MLLVLCHFHDDNVHMIFSIVDCNQEQPADSLTWLSFSATVVISPFTGEKRIHMILDANAMCL